MHLLSDTLDYLKDKDPSRNRYGNSSKGTISSAPVKGRGRILIRDFLLKPYTHTKIDVVEGKEEEVEVTEPPPLIELNLGHSYKNLLLITWMVTLIGMMLLFS